MMSEGIVHSWNNLRQQRQVQQVAAGDQDGNNRSSSSHVHPPPAYVVPMSNNYEVAAELTWENGQLARHGLTGILPPSKAPTFGRAGDTLESIVHQATTAYNNKHDNTLSLKQIQETTELEAAISGGKRAGNMDINNNNIIISTGQGFVKKKMRSSSQSEQSGRLFNNNNNNNNVSESSRMKSTSTFYEDQVVGNGGGGATERSACASATMMTWGASFESDPHGHGSFNTKTTYDDSAFHDASENRDEEMETKGETTVGSHSARRTRAALIHNQSERRRRDRINQKMKALQKLVPNASKTDKASMLDEVINYLKQLQTQVQMMSSARNMPQFMMNPLAMQQQLQMSLLARMGMGVGLGMGMGMLDINALARAQPGLISTTSMPNTTPPFLPPHFAMPAAALPISNLSQAKSPGEATANPSSVPFADPYSAFLAQQAMNMDFYKMAALYRQQANQATQAATNSQPNIIHRE